MIPVSVAHRIVEQWSNSHHRSRWLIEWSNCLPKALSEIPFCISSGDTPESTSFDGVGICSDMDGLGGGQTQ